MKYYRAFEEKYTWVSPKINLYQGKFGKTSNVRTTFFLNSALHWTCYEVDSSTKVAKFELSMFNHASLQHIKNFSNICAEINAKRQTPCSRSEKVQWRGANNTDSGHIYVITLRSRCKGLRWKPDRVDYILWADGVNNFNIRVENAQDWQPAHACRHFWFILTLISSCYLLKINDACTLECFQISRDISYLLVEIYAYFFQKFSDILE